MSQEPPETTTAVTDWLLQLGTGGKRDLDAMLPLVYDELHRLAEQYLSREGTGHTLQPTALLHETYLRLVDQRRVDWRNRAQFIGVAAGMMRRILVDHARARRYLKRGGGAQQVSLDEALTVCGEKGRDLIALDDALTALAVIDARKSEVVELRFFGGLSVAETAEALHVSLETVMRDWKVAKVWLLRELDVGPSHVD